MITTTSNTYPLDTRRAYALAKRLLEQAALELVARNPWLHLADACTLALRRAPHLWVIYRAAMCAGLPSEFQRAKRRRFRPTAKDEAWQAIESLGRTLVAASREPITLRTAVGRVVQANPGLYTRYAVSRPRRSGPAVRLGP